MARYIDADKLIKDLQSEYHGMISDESLKIYKIIHRLDETPTADVVEVKHGEWKVKRDDYDTQIIKCSVCKEEFYPPDNDFDFDFLPNYCMNCGAKMEGRKSNDR